MSSSEGLVESSPTACSSSLGSTFFHWQLYRCISLTPPSLLLPGVTSQTICTQVCSVLLSGKQTETLAICVPSTKGRRWSQGRVASTTSENGYEWLWAAAGARDKGTYRGRRAKIRSQGEWGSHRLSSGAETKPHVSQR